MEALGGIEGDKLALFRGGRFLFRDVALRLASGQTLAVEGANGSGKTSLLRAIAGFLAPHAGTIALRTKSGAIVTNGEERGAYVGWLGHQDGLKSQLTPRETLKFFVQLLGSTNQIEFALDRVGLRRIADLPVLYLSAGQKKRLALARLVLSMRSLWLLDEPLSALDGQGRGLVTDLLNAHCAAGGMVVAATHEPLGVSCAHLLLSAP